MRWISIKDHKPDEGQKVLITDGRSVASAVADIGMISGRIGWYGCGFDGYAWEFDFSDDDVTYWMPLPKPPE